jgi:hypothetical protein
MTAHLQLIPKSRKRASIPPLPHTPSWLIAQLSTERIFIVFCLFSVPLDLSLYAFLTQKNTKQLSCSFCCPLCPCVLCASIVVTTRIMVMDVICLVVAASLNPLRIERAKTRHHKRKKRIHFVVAILIDCQM